MIANSILDRTVREFRDFGYTVERRVLILWVNHNPIMQSYIYDDVVCAFKHYARQHGRKNETITGTVVTGKGHLVCELKETV